MSPDPSTVKCRSGRVVVVASDDGAPSSPSPDAPPPPPADAPLPDALWQAAARGRSASDAPPKIRPNEGKLPSWPMATPGWQSPPGPVARSDQLSFLALLGATRGGSWGILGYTGGHGASSRPASR